MTSKPSMKSAFDSVRASLVFFATVMAVSIGAAPFTAHVEKAATGQPTPPSQAGLAPLLDPESDPYAVLTGAFKRGGWPKRQAAVIAKRLVDPEYVISNDDLALIAATEAGAAQGNHVLLDPESSPYAILCGEFRSSGWSKQDAAVHAATALGMD